MTIEMDEWNGDFDHALQCPACRHGRVVGETGESNGHLARGWIDNLDRLTEVGSGGLVIGPSASTERGSEVGVELFFEQCAHIAQYRFRFHKGDVYLEWRITGEREDHPPSLPRI